jgi:hypothetical protein
VQEARSPATAIDERAPKHLVRIDASSVRGHSGEARGADIMPPA